MIIARAHSNLISHTLSTHTHTPSACLIPSCFWWNAVYHWCHHHWYQLNVFPPYCMIQHDNAGPITACPWEKIQSIMLYQIVTCVWSWCSDMSSLTEFCPAAVFRWYSLHAQCCMIYLYLMIIDDCWCSDPYLITETLQVSTFPFLHGIMPLYSPQVLKHPEDLSNHFASWPHHPPYFHSSWKIISTWPVQFCVQKSQGLWQLDVCLISKDEKNCWNSRYATLQEQELFWWCTANILLDQWLWS